MREIDKRIFGSSKELVEFLKKHGQENTYMAGLATGICEILDLLEKGYSIVYILVHKNGSFVTTKLDKVEDTEKLFKKNFPNNRELQTKTFSIWGREDKYHIEPELCTYEKTCRTCIYWQYDCSECSLCFGNKNHEQFRQCRNCNGIYGCFPENDELYCPECMEEKSKELIYEMKKAIGNKSKIEWSHEMFEFKIIFSYITDMPTIHHKQEDYASWKYITPDFMKGSDLNLYLDAIDNYTPQD